MTDFLSKTCVSFVSFVRRWFWDALSPKIFVTSCLCVPLSFRLTNLTNLTNLTSDFERELNSH